MICRPREIRFISRTCSPSEVKVRSGMSRRADIALDLCAPRLGNIRRAEKLQSAPPIARLFPAEERRRPRRAHDAFIRTAPALPRRRIVLHELHRQHTPERRAHGFGQYDMPRAPMAHEHPHAKVTMKDIIEL